MYWNFEFERNYKIGDCFFFFFLLTKISGLICKVLKVDNKGRTMLIFSAHFCFIYSSILCELEIFSNKKLDHALWHSPYVGYL